ncbi:MAG: hypothetical protein LBT51_03095, partial [Fusobacteriaceae bacterium]|nr:hypothetical protein [Fusobacteriaceae bacterium]
YDDYLAGLRPSYEGFLTVDEVGQLSAVIPEDWKEEWGIKIGIYGNASTVLSGTAGLTLYILWNTDKKKLNISLNTEAGGGGTSNVEASIGIMLGLTNANTVKETEGKVTYTGVDINLPPGSPVKVSAGANINIDNGKIVGGDIHTSIKVTPNEIPYSASGGSSYSKSLNKYIRKYVDDHFEQLKENPVYTGN